MLKDIKAFHQLSVGVAVILENDPLHGNVWSVFVVNDTEDKITNVFVTCKGYGELGGEYKQTSVMRYFLDDVDPVTAVKVEPIDPALFQLNNEYFITFYHNGNLFDKKLVFEANSIKEEALKYLPIPDAQGLELF